MFWPPHWNNLYDFIHMGGKAGYVWGSFLTVALLMIIEPLLLRHRKKVLLARLKRQLRAEQSQEK